jgi:hypothetical protein
MIRAPHLLVFLAALPGVARADGYTPAPPDKVPSYFAEPMPCKIVRDGLTKVECKGELLEHKTLRELSILRNTIYARWGWDGYRKPWLHDYFHSQAWFKPNPKFTYKLLSEADKKNAHFIATREQSFTSLDLEGMRDELFAHHGKVWDDKLEFHLKSGGTVKACKPPKNVVDNERDLEPELDSRDCRFAKQKWYKPNPKYSPADLTNDDKIELGLLSRAMGEFALDNEQREKSESSSLDRILKPEELRQLSLRDLRLLRNTIYARRGRPFKSQILRDHFSGMDWYKINEGYTDKLLSANDTRNITLIKSVENEFGGPLTDEDWLTEPATDGA